jgi:hypothetical protein
MNEAEITECRKAFEEALPKLADHPLWRGLRARVRDSVFALVVQLLLTIPLTV